MMIVEQPINESFWDKYIGEYVDMKLHEPEEFETSLSEIEATCNASAFKKFKKHIENLLHSKYKVRLFLNNDNSGFENSSKSYHVCYESIVDYPDQLEFMKFWLNRFGLGILVIFGTYMNLTGFQVVKRRRPVSLFYYFLAGLFINETIYLILTEAQAIFFDYLNGIHRTFIYLYTYFLLEMRPMFSTSSIFITVAMAKQRFDAIQNPVSYHNAQLDAQHLSCRALLRIFGLEFAAFLVSIPLFLEPMVVEVPFSVRDNVNETHMAMYNITTPEVHPTEIRWNLYHMAVFRSGIDLLATIIIPASLLAYWNLNTQTILKRRAKIHIRNRAKYDTERCGSVTDQGQTSHRDAGRLLNIIDEDNLNEDRTSTIRLALATIKNEEARKARALIFIVVIMAVSNIPRMLLSLHEAIYIIPNYFKEQPSGQLPCYKESDYSHMLNIISNFLLVCNASVVTIVYGVMDAVYRTEFMSEIRMHLNFLLCLKCWRKIRPT